jgi:hypothetical protein
MLLLSAIIGKFKPDHAGRMLTAACVYDGSRDRGTIFLSTANATAE